MITDKDGNIIGHVCKRKDIYPIEDKLKKLTIINRIKMFLRKFIGK